MADFLEYILKEVKNKRLPKSNAIDLIRQFQSQIVYDKPSFLHPLLHHNTSDLSEQRFSSTFTGSEFFLADHMVLGQRVLPGVIYLEMARAAVDQATRTLAEGQTGIQLKNVVWARPIVVDNQPVRVHIRLVPEDNGKIGYEIYSKPEEVEEEPVVHSQGTAVFSSTSEVPTLDIKALQDECSQRTLSSGQCYEAFRGMGIDYGPGHQGIEKVYVGSGQVLAKLSLPSSVSDTQDQFVLYPSLMDSALQASIGLMMNCGDMQSIPPKPVLPFTLKELDILDKCTSSMWVLISDVSKAGDKVQKLDFDLCDENGTICVRMKGFSSRVLEDEVGSIGSSAAIGTLMLHPYWKEQAIASEALSPEYVQHLVMLCEPEERGKMGGWEDRKLGSEEVGNIKMIRMQSQQEEIELRFQNYALQLFDEIQRILKEKPGGKVLVQVVVSNHGEKQLFSGLSGVLKTAQLENPKLRGQLIEMGPEEDSEGIIEKLQVNSRCPSDNQIRYQEGKRWIAAWSEVKASPKELGIPWKDQGIYLITGGAGGLGLIFAREIAQKVRRTTLILIGRSPLNEEKQAQLKELESFGVRIQYRQVDVTNKQAVAGLIQSIREEFGGLHGIIHSAGVIRDNFLLKKTRQELHEVLAPKVTGLVNLDQASKDIKLDFFVLFSSMAGAIGNIGQVDYSTANAFMDAYAGYRNALVVSKQRHGQTLSINWPLWKEGGMGIDEETGKMMQRSGLMAIESSSGIQALYQSLASGHDQVMVAEGKIARIKEKLLSMATPQVKKAPEASYSTTEIDTSSLRDKVQEALIQAVSNLLKVKIEDIDADDTEMNEYGFDSITLTEFTNKLNQEYKLELTPTIFFEHPTLHSLAEYLVKEHRAVFESKFTVQARVEAPLRAVVREEKATGSIKRHHSRFTGTVSLSASKPETAAPETIAIVGMSGRFPMARDVDEFWQNLLEGKDCIEEIPRARWDWRAYYGDPTKEANKTNIKWGGFIEGIDEFDPLFFGISPREAELMDPQQRLLMTYVWKVIEDTGYSAQRLSGTKTAIFVGTVSSGYSGLVSHANVAVEGYSSTGMVSSLGPNRMSYFLNIHGPSEPIETACSSSLVAVHRAVEAIGNGTCDMAIVGGINTIVTPDAHISFSKAGMLCEDGRCKTFSNKANGYVRGEGVGMLFLKKLKVAEQDGDHIYGVILSTAENHGGRATSLTAPNPKAQAELLRTAYTKAGFDPRTVSYIETHGTGTELGDPIEINGLKTAFKELYQATGDSQVTGAHCGLGSVKTNIGHLELAAGIAGVMKVLLQLKHKTLVKNLHCDTINPYIQLKDSPFYLVQETKDWKCLQDTQGKDLPRRAGVSSFGFGGVNAHVVIEEYIPRGLERPQITITTNNPAIIVLSAKNEDRLKEQVQRLLAVIQEQQFSDTNLADMAYTLQLGREAMEERMAIIVKSIKELEKKLKGYVEGQDDIEDLYRGQVKRNKETLAVFASDEELQEAINKWIQCKKFAKLLDLWVKGLNFDWNKLYGDTKPGLISLPTYPFARERYWMQEARVQGSGIRGQSNKIIHPLLHENTSDLSEQRFSSTFTGEEFFLADHIVSGQRVLPGMVYLEMARAAVDQAAGALEKGSILLKNLVWASPIAVDGQPVQVHIGLFPENNDTGHITYEIYSKPEEVDAEPVVHGQGTAVLSSAAQVPTLDLPALKVECNKSSFLSSQCYEVFRGMGIDYGPGFQGLEQVYVGSDQVLAKVSLPSSILETLDEFVLHPSLMDSALQASIGLMMGSDDFMTSDSISPLKPAFPFALKELNIFGNCTSTMWALIRYSDSDGSKAGDDVQELDIDLCDDQGTVCVRMKGLASQVSSHSSVTHHSLQPITAAGSIISNISEKPGGISLRSLSEEQTLSSKPESQIQQSIALPLTKISLSQTRINDESKPVTHVQTAISKESLQEELRTSLAETLYMKQSDVDVDKQFIDMGMDSIIGVEWIRAINKQYGASIPVTRVYDYPNLRKFAGFLEKELNKQGKGLIQTPLESTSSPSLPKQSSKPHLSGLSPKQPSSIRSLSRSRYRRHPEPPYPTDKGTGIKEKEFIAIVGMSGRYPGASNLNQYWDNLVQAKNSIREIPDFRWDVNQYYDPRPSQKGKVYCKWLGLLEDIEYFDPLFFMISPAEAEVMDPQHRLFLQEGYKAFEDAGYSGQLLNNKKCGVYLGMMSNEYGMMLGQNEAGGTITTSNSYAIAAARIPYYLNLKGPAIAIDTACSSSLVATHLACQALLNQEIDMALVGGVTLYLTPASYIGMCEAGMLSPDGQCKTFDNSANGFVPGEGVGALVLKRLKDAQSDHDSIYGVIIGSGINQDGKTNGITAPSMNSQIELEREVYDKYRVDPESIGYVEMHGTGTQLGDPIELEALSTVFKEKTNKKNYCAIGSVKSNIGHTSAASGVAGIQKVLLCMKHKKLVPTLNFREPNEHFNFEDSPFYVNTQLQPWEAASGIPRRASVSSSGFSGTNAHIVFEEPHGMGDLLGSAPSMSSASISLSSAPSPMNSSLLLTTKSQEPGANNPILFVLSAKSKEQLKKYAECMKNYIESHEDLNLADMAYTLQVGREAMEYRLALVADSKEAIIKALEGFIDNNSSAGVLSAQVKKTKDGVVFFEADEDVNVLLQTWIQKKKLKKVAELWVKGLNIDWNQLYGNTKPYRISLPTYPFARERYWVQKNREQRSEDRGQRIGSSVRIIHPLLHENTSDLSEQRYSSTFTGKEFFLADHMVSGQRFLPGVAYLEMAREAVSQATGALENGSILLKNVVWTRPIVVEDQPVQVHIGLFPENNDNGQIAYDIYSKHDEVDAEPLVHSQGTAVLTSDEGFPTLDIKALQAQCNQSSLSSSQCYEALRAMELEYGPGHQGLEKVYVEPGQVLAKLSLPSSVSNTKDQFILHPSLMDSALQASIGLMMDHNGMPSNPLKPVIPFALKELKVLSSCTSSMWSLIRYSEGSKAGDKVQKLDIDLCDDQGKVCVRMKGFSSRVLEGEVDLIGSSAAIGTMMLHPYWKEQALSSDAKVPEYVQHLVMFCEPNEVSKRSIESKMNGMRCITLESKQKGIEKRFETYVVQAFEEIQGLLKDKPRGKVLVQIVFANQKEKQLFLGLSGLLKTARLENPKLIGQLIIVDSGEDLKGILTKLKENSRSPLDTQIRYENNKRWVADWSEVEASQKKVDIPWKDRGIYLITGGAGGLGLIFAKEIAQQVKDTTLILTGRSELNQVKQAQIKELESFGARIQYQQADVTDKHAVADLIQSIQEDFGGLHGIIHSAGVIRDNFILKKTREELQEVLAPKVRGLLNLDQASKDLSLDFFVLFSSIAGAMGNIGQVDYATANAFMDAYAGYRNAMKALKQRKGQTLSINWTLWEKGGMHSDKETEKMMMQNSGFIAMQTPTGIQALYQGLASGHDQVMVAEGDVTRIHAALLGQLSSIETSKTSSFIEEAVPVISQDLLQEKATNYFKKLLSSVIKLPAHRIEADAPLEKYGIDSRMGMQLTNQLEQTFGSLPKTLFFEYENLQELTGYFLESYRNQLTEILAIEETEEVSTSVTEPLKSVASARRPRFSSIGIKSQEEKVTDALDIAIIGVSGRYPRARNIQEFWQNLRAGKDCITEIPKERWDHNLYFDEDKNNPGKTYSKWGGFLEGVDQFDPLFFNISPKEAEMMDPMERLFLETVWTLMESVGYTREMIQHLYQSRVGVYVGAMYQQYPWITKDRELGTLLSNNSYWSIANRISYFFNFKGPSISVDTACSSSLIAIHMACESLKKGDCQIAIAGGVNLSIHPKKYVGLSISQMIGSHSGSRSFGDGDGLLPSEGVGAILLKPLSKAIQDQDSILAIIKSTATNHKGHTNGFTVPNPNAQAQLIEESFIKSAIDPRTISYVESAANGSALGDAIEIAALNKAFQKFTPDQQFCAIGSVKSNIGHAEAASGISQLSKVVLQLQHKQLVPTIKAKPLNPNINFTNTPFYLQQERQEWKRPVVRINGEEKEFPRRATVSSFGVGGSNAHLIVEEYIPPQEEKNHVTSAIKPQIVIFSAKNPDRLRAVIQQMLEFIELQKNLSLTDFAYTLQVGREAMESRAAMVVRNQEELIQGLKEYLKSIKEDKEVEASIPIFIGNLETDYSGIGSLLSGKLGETVLQVLLKEKNLEKLASYWVKGGKIPWDLLHEGEKAGRISLPTYPFEKRRCWLVSQPESRLIVEEYTSLDGIPSLAETTQTSLLDDLVIDIISRILGMTPAEMDLNKPLDQYGFDSILLMQLLKQLQTHVDPLINLDRLQECRTIQDIVKILPLQNGNKPIALEQQTRISIPTTWPQFPELIHLNQISQGRPVFWFHGGLGGVESYQEIARKSQRPFYGIQARGWMTDRSPLYGIQAMVAYYIHIIQSVQPEGPYDLGGYSLGGILAYEVTRQLQELGQTVDTIVMLDSMYSNELKKYKSSQKTIILQAANTALASTILRKSGKFTQIFIHREEVNSNVEDEMFLKQLITLAKARGVTKTETQLRTLIQQNVKVQQAYELGNYFVLPLTDPQAVTCYYFRNKSGIFFGELVPYFAITDDEIPLSHINYWEEWKKQLPNLHMMDVDSSNHMVLLTEPEASETIFAFCERLYSEKGVSTAFLNSLKKKTKKTHTSKGVSTVKKKAAKKAAKKK